MIFRVTLFNKLTYLTNAKIRFHIAPNKMILIHMQLIYGLGDCCGDALLLVIIVSCGVR